MKRVLDRIDSNNLQTLFDPVNLLAADMVDRQKEMINEAFDLFGDKICVIPANFIVQDGVKSLFNR